MEGKTLDFLFRLMANVNSSTLNPDQSFKHSHCPLLIESLQLPLNPSPSEYQSLNEHVASETHLYSEVYIQAPSSPTISQAPLGRFLSYTVDERLRQAEKGVEDYFISSYKSIDPTHQTTIDKTVSFGSWIWNCIGPTARSMMIDSSYFSKIDKPDERAALCYAHDQQQQHQTNIIDLMVLYNGLPQYINVHGQETGILTQFKKRIQHEKETYNLWTARFTETLLLTNAVHYLTDMKKFYDDLYQKVVHHWQRCENSCEKDQFHSEAWRILRKRTKYTQFLEEIRVAHSNVVTPTRSVPLIPGFFEGMGNKIMSWLPQTYIEQPRPFSDICQDVQARHQKGYRKGRLIIFPPTPFENRLKSYTDSIKHDFFFHTHFILENSDDDQDNFTWENQKETFKNYQTLVDCLVYLDSFYNQALSQLTFTLIQQFESLTIHGHLIQKLDSSLSTIRKLMGHKHALTQERSFLRNSFIKQINTQVNKEIKSIEERVKNTVGQKIKRYLIDGYVFDPTDLYEDQYSETITRIKISWENLNEISSYLQEFDINNPFSLKIRSTKHPLLQDQFSQKIYEPLNFSHKITETNFNDPLAIDQLIKSCEGQINGPKGAFWRTQHKLLIQYKELNNAHMALGDQLAKMDQKITPYLIVNNQKTSVFLPYKQAIEGLQSDLKKERILAKRSIKKDIRTKKNKDESLTIGRVFKSAGRKVERLANEGKISHDVPLFSEDEDFFIQRFNTLNSYYSSLSTQLTQLIWTFGPAPRLVKGSLAGSVIFPDYNQTT